MEATVGILVVTLLIIAGAAVVGPRLRIAAPLILVLAGIGVSFMPATPRIAIDPQIILQGVLPPLLYSSAVRLPALNFRRELRAISGLSIVLVALTALALGGLFAWLLPGLGFAWGVALGAIISPTDAVATSLIKSGGAPSRVVVILEGESLLNDATALVVLRTAIVAVAAGFSFGSAVGALAYAVAIAVAVGGAVGFIAVTLRGRVEDPSVSTLLSLATPFAAALPAELLHSSGLVAAVVAGLAASMKAPRSLPPSHRLSDVQTWRSLGLMLEGFIFLTMGLQLAGVMQRLNADPAGLRRAAIVAILALIATVVIRAAYVAPLLWGLSRRHAQTVARQPRVLEIQRSLDAGEAPQAVAQRARGRKRPPSPRFMDQFATRVRRALADIEYLERQPLGVTEGAIVVWAGMRGAVTVAAAQLLPAETPERPFLIFIAFTVAALSLFIQGGTMAFVVDRLFTRGEDAPRAKAVAADRRRIRDLLTRAAESRPAAADESEFDHRVAVIKAQRGVLLDARDDGAIDAEALAAALVNLDAEQLTLELRNRGGG